MIGALAAQETAQETGFLQWGQKITSLGCNWLISIHIIYFDYDWQLTFSECIVILLQSDWSALSKWLRLT